VEYPLDVDMAEVLGAEVGGGPVVPEGHAPRRPPEPDGVLRARDFCEQMIEDPPALERIDIENVVDESRIDE
jgi:hypothetical protein